MISNRHISINICVGVAISLTEPNTLEAFLADNLESAGQKPQSVALTADQTSVLSAAKKAATATSDISIHSTIPWESPWVHGSRAHGPFVWESPEPIFCMPYLHGVAALGIRVFICGGCSICPVWFCSESKNLVPNLSLGSEGQALPQGSQKPGLAPEVRPRSERFALISGFRPRYQGVSHMLWKCLTFGSMPL